jgi:hypothetical protein
MQKRIESRDLRDVRALRRSRRSASAARPVCFELCRDLVYNGGVVEDCGHRKLPAEKANRR